jgi:cellulose synthase/poly-beta-1,6-N-acetylglucosamine synthase-like glycosyltransferase
MTPREHVGLAVMALTTAYFLAWTATQLVMAIAAAVSMRRHARRQSRRARALVARVTPPLVSIVAPAHYEELTIIESVRALLALDYANRELIVVNDGSTDRTLALLQDAYSLVAAPLAYAQPLATAAVRGTYRSTAEPSLVIVDKENGGGKADASNAGINAAAGDYVVIIDADTVLEPDAVTRAVLPVLEDPTTVAVGAYVSIVNGCAVENGRLTSVALPRSWLARWQIVEYMRSFPIFRVACATFNGLTILSGAFGLFRRDAVIAVGGFAAGAIGEDMDLTLRLHRHHRHRGLPYRIAFDPSPLCATQAPEDRVSLRSQRWRWRRGLMQVLWTYRGMIGNPRYGGLGLVSLPYTALFEGLAPLLECASYVLMTIAVLLGAVDWQHYVTVVLVWSLLGTAVSMTAVLLNDVATRRYMRGSDLGLLVVTALLENCGYRQINTWWSVVGTVQALTGKGGWGTMKRRAFDRSNAGASS